MPREDNAVPHLRSTNIKHAQTERINGTIGNFDRFFDFGIQVGNQINSLGRGNDFSRDTCFFTPPEKYFSETFGIAGQPDEQTPCLFDTFFADFPEDQVFIVTLPGGYRVGNDISAAAVQQAMAGACGSCREITFFAEAVGNTAQRQISGNAATGGPVTYNNNVSFNHVILSFFLPVHGAAYGLLPVII